MLFPDVLPNAFLHLGQSARPRPLREERLMNILGTEPTCLPHDNLSFFVVPFEN
jgi:hypothetical protein